MLVVGKMKMLVAYSKDVWGCRSYNGQRHPAVSAGCTP
jgi:hypothetical protein